MVVLKVVTKMVVQITHLSVKTSRFTLSYDDRFHTLPINCHFHMKLTMSRIIKPPKKFIEKVIEALNQ